MTLFDVLIGMLCVVVGVGFWRMRANAEVAREYAQQYCRQQDLVFVSIHREAIHWRGTRRGEIDYSLCFTTDHEVSYVGTITVKRQHVIGITLPAYRDPER